MGRAYRLSSAKCSKLKNQIEKNRSLTSVFVFLSDNFWILHAWKIVNIRKQSSTNLNWLKNLKANNTVSEDVSSLLINSIYKFQLF